MNIAFDRLKKTILAFALIVTVLGTVGCHRSEDDFDDRTLAQRPHVETMAPVDRKDIFRP